MDAIIKSDLYRYTNQEYSRASFLKAMRIPGFRYTYFMRKAAKARKGGFMYLLYRFFLRKYSYKFGYQIPYNAEIGEGFFIGHFGNIVMSGQARIGKNCNISPGVTIGQANRGRLTGAPAIGDKVWMGTNSIIVGNIKIGNDVLIAPGAFVNFNVPDHSMVIGNPGRIVPMELATAGYIENIRDNKEK